MIYNVVYLSDGSVVEAEERNYLPGLYVYALHDFETIYYLRRDWGYSVPRSLFEDNDALKNDSGYPEMVPLRPREGVELTKRLQWFWVRQLVLSKYGISLLEHSENNRLVTIENEFDARLSLVQKNFIINAWRGLTKGHTAFTNGRGTDTCVDFVGKVNMGSNSLPVLWENTCGGHTMLVNSQVITPDMEWIEIKTLKTSEYELWKHADFRLPQWKPFFTLATNSTPYKRGTIDTLSNIPPWKVDPMHYLDGASVPVPLISDTGYVYVHKTRVRVLGQIEKFPSPYSL